MKKKIDKNTIISFKLKSFNIGILYELEKVKYNNKHFDPILNIPKDIEEIKNILKSNPQNILYFLYLNLENIENILYNEDEIIFFDFNKEHDFFLKTKTEEIEIKIEKQNILVFLFYMSLLIKYNENLVNFSISFSFIKKINSLNNIDVYNLYKNVLISKIILELIKFYKSNQIFKEKNYEDIIDKLTEIEKSNNDIIENCTNYFYEELELNITLKELQLKNIDLIFGEIINKLLKIKNYELAYKVIRKLDLENINITIEMLKEIFKTFIPKYNIIDNIIDEYKLNREEDLSDSDKIDFYYFLLKYILKDSIYIYHFKFLNDARNFIFEMIHHNKKKLKELVNNDKEINYMIKSKIIYIIKFFTNTNYYIKLLISNLNDDSIFRPFKNLSYEIDKNLSIGSKYEQNKISYQGLERVSEENENDSNNNNNNPISDNNYTINDNKQSSGDEENSNKSTTYTFNFENEIKKSFKETIKSILDESYIALNIIKEKKIEYQYIFYDNRIINYNDFINLFQLFPEIKNDNDNDKNYKNLKGFLDKIKEISNNSISNIDLKNDLFIKIKIKRDEFKKINSEYSLDNKFSKNIKYQDKNILGECGYEGFKLFFNEIINKPLISSIQYDTSYKKIISSPVYKHSFINFLKVIGTHTKTAEKIRELDNGLLISGGYNELFEYDMNLAHITHNFKNYYSFFIIDNNIIISQENKFSLLNKTNDNNLNSETKYSCRNLFKLKRGNNYLICDENQIYYGSEILNSFSPNKNYETGKKNSYRGGINISDDIIAMTSNRVISKGENKIIFFGSNAKSFLSELEVKDYSFNLSENNCALMNIPEKGGVKLLLVACKKYIKNDENGILLVIIQINKDKNSKLEKFHSTKNFEVYCFCPLFEIENNSYLENNKKTIKETEYFLVGGFAPDKNEGLIKLYKVIYKDKIEDIDIEYIRDIIIGKNTENLDNESKLDGQAKNGINKNIENSKGFIDYNDFYSQENKGKKDLKSSKSFKESVFSSQINTGKNHLEKFKGFKGPISCIIQSSTKGILITCYDGNVYLFSDPTFNLLHNEDEIYNSILGNRTALPLDNIAI